MRSRRWSILFGLVGAAAAGAAGWWGPGGAPTAEAIGLDSVLCPGDEPPVATLDPLNPTVVFIGDAVTGDHDEIQPPVAIQYATDPDGTPDITAGPNGNMEPIDVNGDGQADLELGIGLRRSTAAETVGSVTGATPLDDLNQQNFGRPLDYVADHDPNDPPPPPSAVAVLGYDILLQLPANSWIRQAPQRSHYSAQVGFRFARKDAAGATVDHLEVLFQIDSLQAFARGASRFPDEVRMSLAQKVFPRKDDPNQFYDDVAYWNVGQEVHYDQLALDDYPPLDTGATLTRVGEAREELFDVDLAWDRAPEDFALGVVQTCPSERGLLPAAHFATNLPRPASAGHDLDVAVRSGIDGGIDGSDELRVEGKIEGLPHQLGVVDRAGVVDVIRSPDRVPDLRLRRLDLALLDDDPATRDEPVHAVGRLDKLPAHVRVAHTSDDATGTLSSVTVTACPRPLEGDPLPILAPATAPSLASDRAVEGCTEDDQADDPESVKIGGAHLVVQNFLPDGPYGLDPNGRGPSADLPVAPPPRQELEQDCRYDPPEKDGPWTLHCDEVGPFERTAFVLVAAQHPHEQAGVDTDVLLVRAGADLTGVESATFRTEAGSRRPAGEPAGPDDRTTWGARDATSVSVRAAQEPSAQVVTHLDRRTDLGPAEDDEGVKATARGTVAPLPGAISELSFETLGAGTDHNEGDTAPLRLAWDHSVAATLDLDTVGIQLPGRDADGGELDALEVDGEAELDLPRRGAVDVAERRADGVERTMVDYDFARGLGGGEIDLRLAALVTTRADRQAGRGLRLSGSARVAQGTVIVERRATDGRLVQASTTGCASVAGCDSEVHLDAVLGPDTSVPTLATGVGQPQSAPPVAWVDPIDPGLNDVRVIVDPASGEEWAASIDMRDLVHVGYRPLDGDACVRSAGTQRTTVRVQTPRLWFDGALSSLPDEARLRLLPDGGDVDEPWIWLDATSCTTDEPPVDATLPSAGPGEDDDSGPVLEASAVVSSEGSALAALAPPPANPGGPTVDHIRLSAEQAADGSTAVGAFARQHVPDHLLIWRPVTECGAGGSSLGDLFRTIAQCWSPLWQRTDHQLAGVRVQSTSAALGPLSLGAHVVGSPATGAMYGGEWKLDGSIAQVPGSVHAGVSISANDALGWVDALVDVEASGPIGDVGLTAMDMSPDRVGFTGDAQLTGSRTAVPEYELDLHHVGDQLHVTARLRRGEDVNEGLAHSSLPGHPICQGHNANRRGEPGIAYLHADVDLDGSTTPATELTIDVVNGKEGPRDTDPMGQLATVSSDQPIDATLRTRLTNIVVNQRETIPDPIGFFHHLFVLPAIADLFVGDTHFSACLDFDLPLDLTLTDTSVARFANEGAAFALDADPGADVDLRVGELLDTANPQEGIPSAYRKVSFEPGVGPDVYEPNQYGAVIGGWKDTTAVPVQPGSGDISDCHNDNVAYQPGVAEPSTSNIPTGSVDARVTGRDGDLTWVTVNRARFVLDVLWSSERRDELAAYDMDNFWNELACPGTELFRALAESTPPVDLPVGRIDLGSVDFAEFTITRTDIADQDFMFCWGDGWDTSLANRPGGDGPDYPVAVGADGTRYTLNVWRPVLGETSCRVDLVARYPDGGIRWSRRIVDGTAPPHHHEWGEVTWRVRILPSAVDGSVETHVMKEDEDIEGVRHVLAISLSKLDANGRGEVQWAEGRNVLGLLSQLPGLDRRMNPPDVTLADDKCTHQSLEAHYSVPADAVRVWYMGNGDRVVQTWSLDPRAVDYCYPLGGNHLVQFVDYRHGQEIGTSRRWEVTVPL